MKNYLLPALLGTSIALVSYVLGAMALPSVEVQRIAKQTTVQIVGCGFASGVIIQKNQNTYTVLTVAHAVRNKGCEIATPDDRKYRPSQIKTFPNQVDLAIVTFTSSNSYPLAKLIDNSDRVEAGETIYVSGFPVSTAITTPVFTFVKGDVASNSSTKQQGKGYSLIYSNNTLPGHSGGPVWNDRGEVIAIHGQGDVDTKLQETTNADVRIKTGFNLGITVNTFTKLATAAGLSGYTAVSIAAKSKPVDDLIASSLQKESKGDYRGMLADLDRAIAIAPQRGVLYFNRGVARTGLKDSKGAIADYDRAIAINPNDAGAYKNRSIAKSNVGNNKGAIADSNRAITLNPTDPIAYNVRALAQVQSGNYPAASEDSSRAIALNPENSWAYLLRSVAKIQSGNLEEGLDDLNRAIVLNPRDGSAYQLRGALKSLSQDKQGAVADLKKAAQLYQQQGLTDNYNSVIKEIKRLGF